MKKYYLSSVIYAVLALLGGVFYREFTKGFSYVDKTTLSIVHVRYHVGLNLTCAMFLVRGILQVTLIPLSDGLDGMVSGFAGIGDVILGGSLLLLLVFIYLNVFKKKKQEKE